MGAPSVLEIQDEVSWWVHGLKTSTAAQGAITLTGLPSVGEYFTVGGQVFTFAAARAVTGDVAVGLDVDATLANIATSLTLDVSETVSAAASISTDKVIVTATWKGISGNLIPFSESASNLTMDGSGFLGATTPGVTGDDLLSLLNEGMRIIAGRVLLEDLETDSTVTTSASVNYVALPTNFHKNLMKCYSTTNSRWVQVHKSTRLLFRQFGTVDTKGSVVGVTVRGSKLYYQRLAAETLKLYYYAHPTKFTALTDLVDELPEHLAKSLLVNYACSQIWSKREDANEAQRVNTQHHLALFEQAMQELQAYLGPEAKEVHEITDDLNLEAYL
jgi:hypothetical protein